mmetsp:Transcript_23680/g.32326  ORF Transcript_23680/g.32326 Transcript_23680/m.32326 type:complete len:112 (+) Transcript_23680:56-391(+)
MVTHKPLTREAADEAEREEFERGPLSVLDSSLKSGAQIFVYCRDNHKMLGRVRAFDRHMNLIMDNVQEIWVERDKSSTRGVPKRRSLSKVFVRGDNVILVVKNPQAAKPAS